ncbi:MAG: carbon-nitrogen hydrolase family protein [Opitutales bacterium]
MRVSLAQYSVVSGEIDRNLSMIDAMVREAADREGADLVCLPELCTTGFNWKRNAKLSARWRGHREAVADLSRRHGVDVCGSFLESGESGKPTNTFLYFDSEGRLIRKYNKIHLFSAFKEHLHVHPGDRTSIADTRFGRIGCAICYDLRFPELFRKNTVEGARMHVLPAAFPKPRLPHWRILVQARALENQSFVFATNQCGFEGDDDVSEGVEYFGHSMIVDPGGEVLVEAGEEAGIATAEIDLGLLESSKSLFDTIRDRRPELY